MNPTSVGLDSHSVMRLEKGTGRKGREKDRGRVRKRGKEGKKKHYLLFSKFVLRR